MQQTTWGGDDAGLIADDSSAHVHIGRTYGQVHQPIVPDAAGRLDAPGEQNITAHPVDLGILHPARFSGRIVKGRMSLTGRPDRHDRDAGPGAARVWQGAEDADVPDLPAAGGGGGGADGEVGC